MERFSKNRQAILDCLRSTPLHPTAEWVYHQLRATYPNLSLGTVYRNLCQLKDAGMIRSMGVIAGEEHFDGTLQPHAHMICHSCGRIDDLPISDELASLAATAEAASGFSRTSPSFVGLCPDCAKALS